MTYVLYYVAIDNHRTMCKNQPDYAQTIEFPLCFILKGQLLELVLYSD